MFLCKMLRLQILFSIIFSLSQVIQSLQSNGLIRINPIFNLISNLSESSFKSIENSLVNPDAFLLTHELIQKYGYKAEKHIVRTKDGYLLEMHRIPKEGGQPVVLMHGLLDSSATWVLMGPGKGLGYLLSDLGYDVWMGNVRGNRYSRQHEFLNSRDGEFWKFSLDEMGKYDMPAMIDYVLRVTGFKKLHYIGHSQGTAIFWILCHEYPEYNNKIISMQALGPVAFIPHCKSPVVQFMVTFMNELETLLKMIGRYEFLPNKEFVRIFAQVFCKDGTVTQAVCENIIFLMVGYNEAKLNQTMIPVIGGHAPAGASTQQVLHYGQLTKSGRFCKFDFGKNENLKVYGTKTPPDYDLSRTKVPVVLYYAENDWLTVPQDVVLLRKNLPNVIGSYLAEDKNYNHLDFLWAIDAKTMIYEKIFKILRTFH